jgi:hypothetical protein
LLPTRGAALDLTSSPFAEKTLRYTGLGLVVIAAATATVDVFDDIPMGGADFWSRLVKFQFSLAIHFFTLALVIQTMNGAWRGSWLLAALAIVTAAAGLGEALWMMSLAAASFVPSPALARFTYGIMGAGAVAIMGSAFIVGLAEAFDRRSRAASPLRLAVVIGLVGGATLTLLVGLALGQRGGSHVGVHPPGGAVVPFLGWSLVVGDLRTPYFFALHSMQVVPLWGWLVARLFGGGLAVALVIGGAATWMVLTLFLLERALRGVPLL